MKNKVRNLFNSTIKIECSKLIFNNLEYNLSDIVSIEKVEEPILLALKKRHFGNRYTKCTLKTSEIIEISSVYSFEANGLNVDYDKFISKLLEKSENIKKSNEGWLPVRLLIPSAITQVVAIFVGFLIFQNFDKAFNFAIINTCIK